MSKQLSFTQFHVFIETEDTVQTNCPEKELSRQLRDLNRSVQRWTRITLMTLAMFYELCLGTSLNKGLRPMGLTKSGIFSELAHQERILALIITNLREVECLKTNQPSCPHSLRYKTLPMEPTVPSAVAPPPL